MSQQPLLLPQPRHLRLLEGSCPVSADATPQTTIDAAFGRAQGYRLKIDRAGVDIVSTDAAGSFYAIQTLAQLRRQFGTSLPCLEIEDWPDFPARGVMLDISRDKVPTMATLLDIVDQLAELKTNQLQLYPEH